MSETLTIEFETPNFGAFTTLVMVLTHLTVLPLDGSLCVGIGKFLIEEVVKEVMAGSTGMVYFLDFLGREEPSLVAIF